MDIVWVMVSLAFFGGSGLLIRLVASLHAEQ